MKTRTVKADSGLHDAECECGFVSAGWANTKLAKARIAQHADEHETGKPMPELADFKPEGDS